MTKCAYCGTRIFVGGTRDGTLKFCNRTCHREAYLAAAAEEVPETQILELAQSLHTGPCPRCKKAAGPVEVHLSHRIHSMLVLTQWQSFTHVSCRACARKKQLGHAAYSLFLGWWGIPWGLALTPVQITRNLRAMMKKPPTDSPSPALIKVVRRNLGSQILAQAQGARTRSSQNQN